MPKKGSKTQNLVGIVLRLPRMVLRLVVRVLGLIKMALRMAVGT